MEAGKGAWNGLGDWDWHIYAAAAAKSLQSRPTLCDPIDGSPPGSAIPGILQARTLEWVAISFSNARKWEVKVAQSCPTLSDPMDCSPLGSSIHGIFQARVLEWGAIAFSHTYASVYKIDNRWELTVQYRELYSMLCGDLNIYICVCIYTHIHVADSLCCTAETNTIL